MPSVLTQFPASASIFPKGKCIFYKASTWFIFDDKKKVLLRKYFKKFLQKFLSLKILSCKKLLTKMFLKMSKNGKNNQIAKMESMDPEVTKMVRKYEVPF